MDKLYKFANEEIKEGNTNRIPKKDRNKNKMSEKQSEIQLY